jgi:hypothetical protein
MTEGTSLIGSWSGRSTENLQISDAQRASGIADESTPIPALGETDDFVGTTCESELTGFGRCPDHSPIPAQYTNQSLD